MPLQYLVEQDSVEEASEPDAQEDASGAYRRPISRG
jgi:hypothetical protein